MKLNLVIVLMLSSILLSSSNKFLSMSIDEVWNKHINDFTNRNLDEIVKEYDENSFLIINNKIFKGISEIRYVFERLFSLFDQGETSPITPVIERDIIYLTYTFNPNEKLGLKQNQYFGSDTFVFRNGKIITQTIASKLFDDFQI